ncbi:hypothetical protein TB2_035408 [Malus domestica]
MKLGVNRTNGHVSWISSWETKANRAPGPFTLDWDPHQLKIKKGEESKLRYNFSIVSNENEDSLTCTALDLDQDSEWVLNSLGRLGNRDFEIAHAKISIAEP